MQTQNNNNFMNSITGDTKYFTIISKYELKAEAFILLIQLMILISAKTCFSPSQLQR